MYSLEELQEGKIFSINKPLDWTSFDIVNKIKWRIRKHFNIKKIKVGHAGTLDPKATGLLIVCVGKATKQIQQIQDASKIYTGTIKLGVQTPSYDTETEEINSKNYEFLTEKMINEAVHEFIGEEIQQIPPVFSALKKEGKRLYELARKGEQVDVPARMISIYDFKITQIALPYVDFEVHCSKGTYIRSLAHDFGNQLGTGGYLTSLHRAKIGEYEVEKADNSIILNENFFSTGV
ncbi:tRNA pseudouridine(55) synthase TruB [Apibacter sp. HY039]|uniref:tRNA pseudouridine(55) synthase TruB n=1 Tax=Apibacter sp. HY039 TaxID=2501476 RepID=UPI000FEB87AD|nr:tRNA pseudouridine(55) synthase TruB [Apibacter sp. HY039]